MGPRVASKIPSRSGQRDGIFDAAQGPVWYFYYLIVSILCENICKNTFSVRWHQKVALKILVLQIVHYIAKKFVKILNYLIHNDLNEIKKCFCEKIRQNNANFAQRDASKYGIKNWHQSSP